MGDNNNSDNATSTTHLELTVRLSNGTRLQIDVGATTPTTCTVLRVKEALVHECPIDRQRLIYKGRILEDNERTLQDYGIVHQSTLFLVKGGGGSTAAPSTPSNAAAAVAAAPPPAPTPAAAPPAAPANPWGGMSSSTSPASSTAAANPFAAAMGNPMMMGNNNNNNNNPMAAALNDPARMQEMMNSPLMQSLLDNPQMMQNMMELQMQTNPQMRQVMENNPALRQMLSDPAVLQQVSQLMRNPAAMQQAMRNQDLAMSNIENMPGGFAALSSMYRDVQQPLEESMRGGGGGGNADSNASSNANNNSNNRQQFDAGASGSAMPNPWGDNTNNASTTNSNTNAFPGMPPITRSAPAAQGNPWAQGGDPAAAATNSSSTTTTPPPADPFAALMGGAGGGGANPFAAMMGGGMPGQPPSQDQMNAALNMLENPAMQQMLEQAVNQNPDVFRQMMQAQNPALAQLPPEQANQLVRSMMNPQVLRSMVQMQQAFANAGFNPTLLPQQPPGQAQPGSAPPQMDFGALLQQMNSTGISSSSSATAMPPNPFFMPPAPQQPQQAPADRYRNQLRSLYDMGFDDEQQCLAALQTAHGNLNRAVDLLLSGEVPASAAAAPPAADSSTNEGGNPEGGSQTAANDASSNDDNNNNTAPKDATEKKND